jgi:arylsulfatase A-like enzyme
VHYTPQIDRLAKEGMRFPNHYCPAPVCAPSRASLLLGVHQGHANVRDNQFDKELEKNHTLATVLKGAGYATACIGKWGLAGKPATAPPDWPSHPLNRGFDYFYGYIQHTDGHEHYPKEGPYRKPKQVWDNRSDVSAGLDKCYTTDLFTARAKKWITDHSQTNAAQPFFLDLAYDTPHATLELPTQEYPSGGGLRGGLQWLGEPGRMINTAGGVVDAWFHPDYANAAWDHDKNAGTPTIAWPDVYKRFATDVRRIDDGVGDIQQLLRDLNADTNTLVVFTSDNGPSRESYLKQDYEPTFFSSFGPFDGLKRDCLEGGLRVGAIVRWPGAIAPNQKSDLSCAFWDWMPTFAELGGVPAPARTDGKSLVPTLLGKAGQKTPAIYAEYFVPGKTPVYAEFEPGHRDRMRRQMQAIRLGDFMGVRYNITNHSDAFEIFNVVLDPKQTTDTALRHPDLQQEMKNRVLQIRRPDPEAPRPYDRELIPPAQAGPGVSGKLQYAVYVGDWPWLPDFETLTPVKRGLSDGVDPHVLEGRENAGILFSGFFHAPEDGDYVFFMKTDMGAQMRLHEALVLDDDFNHAGGEVSALVRLQAGRHPVRIYYRHKTGSVTFQLECAGPGFSRRPMTPELFQAAPAD